MHACIIRALKRVNDGHLGFDGHIEIIELAAYSNMKAHIQMHLCAKFHACIIKCTHLSPFCWTVCVYFLFDPIKLFDRSPKIRLHCTDIDNMLPVVSVILAYNSTIRPSKRHL